MNNLDNPEYVKHLIQTRFGLMNNPDVNFDSKAYRHLNTELRKY